MMGELLRRLMNESGWNPSRVSCRLFSFGRNWDKHKRKAGQLGRGGDFARPGPVCCFGEPVVAVAAGSFHSLAVTRDGRVYSWGYNMHGQLGFVNRGRRSNQSLVSRQSRCVLSCAVCCVRNQELQWQQS